MCQLGYTTSDSNRNGQVFYSGHFANQITRTNNGTQRRMFMKENGKMNNGKPHRRLEELNLLDDFFVSGDDFAGGWGRVLSNFA